MVWVNDIIQGILAGGQFALFACGLSLLFGVMKVVNLAHGDLAVVGAYIGIGIIAVTHMPFLWSIPVVCVLMAVLGYVLQRSLIQSALNRGELTTLIVTFGLSIVIENGLQQFFTADTRGYGVGSSIEKLVVLDRTAGSVRLATGEHLRGGRDRAARPAVLPVRVEVRPDDPGGRRRP